MAKEICISSTPHETRLAIIEDDQLTEIYYERENEYTLAGSIYKGKVTRVLPGMQSAFVDVGLERDAFLYVTDFLEEQEDGADFEAGRPAAGGRREQQAPTEGGRERTEGRREGGRGRRGDRSQAPATGALQVTPEATGSAAAEAEGGAEQEGQPGGSGEEFQEGTRRWRGRRGRRRGVRGAGGQEGGTQRGSSAGQGEDSRERDTHDRDSQDGNRVISIEAAGEPAAAAYGEEHRGETARGESGRAETGRQEMGRQEPGQREGGRPRRERSEGGRSESGRSGGGRSEDGRSEGGRRSEREPQQTTVTLPGEALQRYGQQPVEAEAGTDEPVREKRPKQANVTVRPSTLVEQPLEWDGITAAMPGETLSRHRERPAAPAQSAAASSQEHSAMQEPAVTTGTADLHAETSETATIDSAFPPAHPEESAQGHGEHAVAEPVSADPVSAVPLVREEEEAGSQPEGDYDPERASASHRVDPSAPREFRLSSLFGRDSGPSDDNASDDNAAAGKHEPGHREAGQHEPGHHEPGHASATEPYAGVHEEVHEELHGESAQFAVENDDFADAAGNGPHSQQESTREAAALDHIHAFTPGDGQVEEEVIDEEEYDFAPLPEHALAQEDEHDLGDLVEEETQAAGSSDIGGSEIGGSEIGGSEIGDVIRDAQIDRQVISSDDDEADDTDDAFDEEEAEHEGEQPAAAVAGEEGVPAPRRGGRNDRQRGRGDRRGGRNGRQGGRRQSAQTTDLPIISELLKQGQEILVQIAKEPIAKKGARITSHIALPGRFLVFMPTVNHVGVSRKIWSDEERQRLKRVLISEKGDASGGFIVRTAAENATEEELRADLRFLISLWNEIKQRSDAAKAPALIYHDLNLIERILRDQVSDNFSTIWVDSEAEYERIVRFLNRFQPSLVRRVKLYTKETPLFEHFGIQDEISKALKSKVWLKSGGSIVINQTEALVAIDINTGKYVGKTARLEDTILKTNLDAIPEIVRQIRLRDLGGIIVIDFIDMDERKNRHKVMAALEEELKSDRAPSKVLQFNDFGLVAITRKRVKQSLERTLSVQCNICAGTGMVKGPITVANEIYIEMRKMQKHFERHDVMLRVHPEVVKTLKNGNARWLNDMEEMTGRTIIVKSDPALHPEQFDIH